MKFVWSMSLVVLFSAFAAKADIYGFNTITSNAPNREAISHQLFMDVATLSSTQSDITFTNIGPASSSISEIYFGTDLSALDLTIDGWSSCSDGVVFDITGANPPNPPGWEEFSHWWSITIASAESTSPPSQNGINPYECLDLELSYASSFSLSELIASGEVQVALHVIDIGEYSDTYVNGTTPLSVIPEPASIILIGAAGTLLGFIRRVFVV